MALSRSKTWIAAEILTASDLNNEFNNILNNPVSLISPLTAALDMDGKEIVLDADADSSLTADTDDRLDLKLSGTDLFRFDGTATTPVNGFDFIAAAAASEPSITAVGSDTDISVNLVPKGAGVVTSAGATLAIISKVQDWTASQSGEVTALSDGANIALDLSLSNNFSVTLGGNRTLDNPTNDIPGQSGVITATQDSGAPRTLSYGNQYEFVDGAAPVLSTSNGETDTLYYYVEAANKILISSALNWS